MDFGKLIDDYLYDINCVVSILKQKAFEINHEDAWQRVLYPDGSFTDRKIRYHFHGAECWVKCGNKIIYFDFIYGDSEKGIWGIDCWFLACYLESIDVTLFDPIGASLPEDDSCQTNDYGSL